MRGPGSHLGALAALFLLGLFAWAGARELERHRGWERDHPYSALARRLGGHASREWCDEHLFRYRQYASAVVDRFRQDIRGLWKERGSGQEPRFSLLDLGAIQIRVNPPAPSGAGFESSAWSWEEAYGLIRKTQTDPQGPDNADRWRDVDSMVRYLLEKDSARVLLGRKFLPPDQAMHRFRPEPSVRRTGPREFTVSLDPGDFRGYESVLQRLLEAEWRGHGYRLRIAWAREGTYRLTAHRSSNRSFVSHKGRRVEIAHLAWSKTVAHELGHVLGFDDHYYNVWNARNCYYSQESRLGDIMSNSERGVVTMRHWEILSQAYPWKADALGNPFSYVYGK